MRVVYFKAFFMLLACLFLYKAKAQPTTFNAAIGNPANGSSHFISLNWSAVSGAIFEVEVSEDNLSWGLIYSGSALNFDHNSGNKANAPFYYRIRSIVGTPSAWKNAQLFPIFTAADEPALPLLSNATTTSMTLVIPDEAPVPNPSITTYSIFSVTTGLFVQANGTLGAAEIFQTKLVWGTVNISGLNSNTNYCFFLKAKNNDGDIRTAIGNALIPVESFDNTSNFNTSSSAPTNRYWSPSSCTTGGLVWNGSNGCPGGAVGFQGSFNNFFGCFLRSPAINATGLNEVEITFDLSHTFSSATATNRMRIYFWADGAFNSSSISSLEINGANKLASFGVNGQGIFYDEARNCTQVKVVFNISGVADKSGILFYLEPNSNFNNSFVFSTWIDNVSINGNANASACMSTLSCVAANISNQPLNRTICENSSTNFSITTSGTINSLQWQESQNNGASWSNLSNGGMYSGVNTTTLTLANVSSAANGYWYRVQVVPGCGGNLTSNTALLAVNSLPSNAGSISGTSEVCINQSNVIFEISPSADATGYSWALPAGANIISGQNTNQISVNFSGAAVSGIITVTPINGCGSGGVSSGFNIMVSNTVSGLPDFTNISQMYCAGDTIELSVFSVPNATSYNWRLPSSWYSNNSTFESIIVVADTSGTAFVSVENVCGISAEKDFFVEVSQLPPSATVLLPPFNVDTLSICGNNPALNLSASDSLGIPVMFEWMNSGFDTSVAIVPPTFPFPIDSVATISVRSVNGCGTSSYKTITLFSHDLPQVELNLTNPLICLTAPISVLDTLSGGIPMGGVYSGVAVSSDSLFDTNLAGEGTHAITYTFTDINGCTNSAQANITVEICVGISDAEKINFLVYPNPFSTDIIVENLKLDRVEMFDQLGRKIQIELHQNNSGQLSRIKPKGMTASGIYILKIFDMEGHTYQRKVTRLTP